MSADENKAEMEVEGGDLSEIGLYGLGVMGQNLALNIAEHGFSISVSNRSDGRVRLSPSFLLYSLHPPHRSLRGTQWGGATVGRRVV
jgi:hypothetical protein